MPDKKPMSRSGQWRLVLVGVALTTAGLFFPLTRQDRLDGALRDAIRQADAERVRPLLEEGANARGYIQNAPEASRWAGLLAFFTARGPGRSSIARTNANLTVTPARPGSVLMAAVDSGDAAMVNALLERGADPNYALDNGRTALFLSMARDNPPCLLALLRHGARMNDRDSSGDTPLHLAAQSNSSANIRVLLDNGADSAATDGSGKTVLAVAAEHHAGQAVCALLERGANEAELYALGYDPPLVWATAAGGLSAMRRIWEKPIPPGQRKAESAEALFRAVCAGNFPAAAYLLNHGVSPNFDSRDLGMSSSQAGPAAARLQGHLRCPSLLIAAAAAGDPELVDLLLAHGAKPNAKGSGGETPLLAIGDAAAHELVMSRMLRSGATEFRTVAEMNRAWYHAFANLLDRGADVQSSDKAGRTALMLCVRDEVLVGMLIRRGASVNSRDRLGRTALMRACERRGTAVDRLLAAGAQVNDSDSAGATPLMYAVQGYPQSYALRTVGLLAARGADANARDKRGRTVLMRARMMQVAIVNSSLHPANAPANELEAVLMRAGAKHDAPGPAGTPIW